MVTPNDIATKDFKKVAVGYSPEEVDTFLDDIYEDYEKLYNESMQSKTKTEVVQEDTDRLRNLEKTLERTLSPVSYTHLDVYKRQVPMRMEPRKLKSMENKWHIQKKQARLL